MAMRFRHLRFFAREAVGVYRSSIHGRGLYSKREFEPGEMIMEYTGEVGTRYCLLRCPLSRAKILTRVNQCRVLKTSATTSCEGTTYSSTRVMCCTRTSGNTPALRGRDGGEPGFY